MKKIICSVFVLFSLSTQAAETKTAEEMGKVLIYSLINEGDQPDFSIEDLTLSTIVVDKNNQIDKLIFKSYDYTEYNCTYDKAYEQTTCETETCKAEIVLDVNPRGKSSYGVENVVCSGQFGSGRGSNRWQR